MGAHPLRAEPRAHPDTAERSPDATAINVSRSSVDLVHPDRAGLASPAAGRLRFATGRQQRRQH